MAMTVEKKPRLKPTADAEARQAALDNISAADLAKIKAHQASTQGAYPVDQEWLLLAEFGMKFGWQAYLDAKTDKIQMSEMLTLIEASRKIEWAAVFNDARTSLIGTGAANSKKPSQAFRSLTKDIVKNTRISE